MHSWCRSLPLLMSLSSFSATAATARPGETGAILGIDDDGQTGALLLPAGDIDHDGRADLLVGAPGADKLYLVFDSASQDGPISTPDSLTLYLGSSDGSSWASVAAAIGDLDEDGEADLVVGLTTPAGSGQVAIFLGPDFWYKDYVKLSEADQKLTFDEGTRAGHAVAIGPNPADGGLAIFIGAPGAAEGRGEVYAISTAPLKDPLLQRTGSAAAVVSWSPATYTGAEAGTTLYTGGDFDHDGTTDLAIGAPGAAGGGAVFLLLSGSPILGTDLEQRAHFVLGTPGGRAGMAITRADVDSDGQDDLFIGAPGDGSLPGQAFLILDREAFFQGEPLESVDLILTGTEPGDRLGASLAGIADLDGDRYGELLVGSPGLSSGKGAVGLFRGRGDLNSLETLSQADIRFDGLEANHGFGEALVSLKPTYDLTWISAPGAQGATTGAAAGELAGISLQALADDRDADGFSELEGDCDDGSATRAPGAKELCNGLDDDCDDEIDENPSGGSIWYADVDLDGFGDPNASLKACVRPEGYVSNRDDCADSDPERHPEAAEACDGKDNDCNGEIPLLEQDSDGDGYLACLDDCDDSNPLRHPGVPEQCNGIDDDCDGRTPETESDRDEDGWRPCSLPADCDDTLPERSPGQEERCDGLDNDCDGATPKDESDDDRDGFRRCDGDCDDLSEGTFPGALEACDGEDNDCDGLTPDGELDEDGDGYRTCDPLDPAFDCDDATNEVHPDAEEVCDEIDNDCDGQVDGIDADDDGVPACAPGLEVVDCDDDRAEVYPGAPEICDALDNNCDGVKLEGEVDADSDGYLQCQECDDSRAEVHPGATEVCDGLDTDCSQGVPADEQDADGDGVSICEGDCNDASSAVHPEAPELCDTIDNDCDRRIDESAVIWYPDRDGDGYGVTAEGKSDCEAPSDFHITQGGDCNDLDPQINPAVEEVCDGVDNNCDNLDDNVGRDKDRDGYNLCQDCDDEDEEVNPRAAEVCADLIDNNCDGETDEGTDADDDGVTTCEGDCDDDNWQINPGRQEIGGNEVDENCDGIATDRDDDGHAAPDDCQDADPSIHPGQPELPGDGIDNDCDGVTDPLLLPDAPGIGCGALAGVDGVSMACSTAPGSNTAGTRAPGAGGLFGLFAVSLLFLFRRRGSP